ncbi:hypothetical protein [Aureliella helgolandensis]|uniref:LTXXQ motif protein n=1 Tax=Aureliella helgolandensis TaxID=2527968 RepID=A0A518G419_9BACT|nr:hypothetical protein [Aureliella helgolandensis]QDV23337.1 hypothetical protein Q31a_16350 [Aureliella helgolandensis]
MVKKFHHLGLASIGLAIALATAGDTYAQCSGGRGGRGGGGPSTSSPTSFNSITSSSTPGSFDYQQALMQQRQQMYAMQQQLMLQRMQMAALQRQWMQGSGGAGNRELPGTASEQEVLIALRRERAEEQRADRAERIAEFKAKRDAENRDASETHSPVRLASTKASTPVLAQIESPYPN